MIKDTNNRLSTSEGREAFFMELYKKAYYSVAAYIARMGGSQQEAEDIFQDSLVIYYEKITSPHAEFILNEKAYLTGIAKKLWLQHYNANHNHITIHEFDTEVEVDEQHDTNKIMYYLSTAGKKCMELLKAYYYDHLPVGDIASAFGYSGTRSATVAKYKCLEKVRETVKQNSLEYADFVE